MNKSVTIFGGTGRTGSLIASMMADKGENVTVATRKMNKVQTSASSSIRYMLGDITHENGMKELLAGSKGIIIVVESSESSTSPYSPKNVHYQGMLNIINTIQNLRLDLKIVLISQIYITRPDAYSEMKEVIQWRGKAEQELRKSGIPYTIVRPSWLTNQPSQPIRLEQGDTGEGHVSRLDVARVCVEAFFSPQAVAKTFEIYNSGQEHPDASVNWFEQFAELKPDA